MPLLHEGTMIAGKYRLERSLARGGMGSVWVARHVQLNMHVAIKFMDTGSTSSDEARARFDREAKAAAQIQSPHVAQVHDYGVEAGVPYIAMELLHGEDLGHRLRRQRRLSLAEVAKILAQASKALRKAHEAGLIHRDLKPANIFLARGDDDEEIVKILDFGVVKITTTLGVVTDATQTGIVVGSVNYMSPEQARGLKELDHRSDLWSLGVLAFRALVGEHPFPGEQVGDVIVKICSEPIPKPSDLAPDLGPEVDHFFRRALARDLAERFQSAREFANDLCMLARIAPLGSTGAWPIAFAARAALPSVAGLNAGSVRAAVIHDGNAPSIASHLSNGERRPSGSRSSHPRIRISDVPTAQAAPSAKRSANSTSAPIDPALAPGAQAALPGAWAGAAEPLIRPLSPYPTSGAMLTDAAQSSDGERAFLSSSRRGKRLVAIGATVLTVMICAWLVLRGGPVETPAAAVSVPSPPTAPASSAAATAAELPSSAPSSAPLLSASAKTQAAPVKSSRSPTGAPSSGRHPKGSPARKINSTLGI
jgi:eukaryotic-like serine/threonine-protein kinase